MLVSSTSQPATKAETGSPKKVRLQYSVATQTLLDRSLALDYVCDGGENSSL